mgnify:CR=1 FL=1
MYISICIVYTWGFISVKKKNKSDILSDFFSNQSKALNILSQNTPLPRKPFLSYTVKEKKTEREPMSAPMDPQVSAGRVTIGQSDKAEIFSVVITCGDGFPVCSHQ